MELLGRANALIGVFQGYWYLELRLVYWVWSEGYAASV